MEQSADELNTADGLLGDGGLGNFAGRHQYGFFPVCQGFHQKLRFQLRNPAGYRGDGHSKSKKRTN